MSRRRASWYDEIRTGNRSPFEEGEAEPWRLGASVDLMERGDHDFSISRAYYSMFYCAEALLLSKDMKFSKHSAVISYFGREFVRSGLLSEELYGHLIKGFRKRQIGDYEVLNLPIYEDAEGAYTRCKKLP